MNSRYNHLVIFIFLKLSVLSLVQAVSKELIPNQYIVKLRDDVNPESFVHNIVLTNKNGMAFNLNANVKYTYSTIFNGFSVKLDETHFRELYAMDTVEYIVHDNKLILDDKSEIMTQTTDNWGLARLSSSKTLTGGPYIYSYNSTAGNNTYAYIIDSGINMEHEELEDRAILGPNYVEYEENRDLNGHGTHCAGIIAGKTFGVAKKAHVIGVKIFAKDGSATNSQLLVAMEWVINDAQKYGINRCVLNLSAGGPKSQLINEATEKAIKLGMTVVVAAGNQALDACRISPASSPNAIAVGAIDITDKIAWFSNFGQCVDIYAPGVKIKSAIHGSKTATGLMSGTSMATPHVSGLVCYFKSIGYDCSPKVVELVIKEMAAENVIVGMPANTINRLAQNDMAKNNPYQPNIIQQYCNSVNNSFQSKLIQT